MSVVDEVDTLDDGTPRSKAPDEGSEGDKQLDPKYYISPVGGVRRLSLSTSGLFKGFGMPSPSNASSGRVVPLSFPNGAEEGGVALSEDFVSGGGNPTTTAKGFRAKSTTATNNLLSAVKRMFVK